MREVVRKSLEGLKKNQSPVICSIGYDQDYVKAFAKLTLKHLKEFLGIVIWITLKGRGSYFVRP